MLQEAAKGNSGDMYKNRNFDKGPKTYNDPSFEGKIFAATGLEGTTGLNVLDLMSGPGKMGKAMQKLAPDHTYHFLDLGFKQLSTVQNSPDLPVNRINADARKLPLAQQSMDVVVARYAIKDLQKTEQPQILDQIWQTLKPGGILIIADMVAPEIDGSKEWLNMQHSLKQEFGGRDTKRDGVCHIPTRKEWLSMCDQAGFKAEIADTYVSRVATVDWRKGNQVNFHGLIMLNNMILNAPSPIKQALNIRREDRKVKIDYPVVIIKATKN